MPAVVILGAAALWPGIGAAPAVKAAKGLRVEYKATGSLPRAGREDVPPQGGRAREATIQRITLDPSGTRLLLEELDEAGKTRRKLILRADKTKPVIYEILDGKSYREHSGDLNEHQRDRRIVELQEIESTKTLPKKEREEFFRENPYLRPDGSREAKVAKEPGEPVFGRPCDRIRVTENGRTIVEGLVTKDVPGANSFELYRRLGAFSDEVLRELAKVEGVLLRGKITVVTALRADELEVEATRLEEADVPPNLFEVDGLTKVESVAKEAKCPVCGKVVDTKRATRYLRGGAVYYLCSEEHADVLRREGTKGPGGTAGPGK
ncbi:MAG: hypothetical protein HY721_09870 [Planctomycetes bacterium]|nr:hypothetical protein [Planctomycetota bacterium]